jgi:hypothetical protein
MLSCCHVSTNHMTHHSELLVFWTSSSGVLETRKQCFGNWICLDPGEGAKGPTLLGPLERANLNHWIEVMSNDKI